MDTLASLVTEINSLPHVTAYHRIDFGEGVVLNGTYDIAKYLHHYHLPENLNNSLALDIGTATGFFAIEMAKRGARVMAIDKGDWYGYRTRLFNALCLPIVYRDRDIYDQTVEYGYYDLVVCGSLLLHLPDPLRALRTIHSICRGRAIISTSCTADSQENPKPIIEVAGIQPDYSNWTYWMFSAAGLEKLCLTAGFSRVENVEHFMLEQNPHVVLHAI